jgi:hypothetical protein
LIARLEETASGGLFQWEVNRRARVVEDLDRARRHLAARRVRIPAAADTQDRRVRDLSGDIALKPGELRIEFFGAEDLAAKLFELSQAMANDWQAFSRAVEQENIRG